MLTEQTHTEPNWKLLPGTILDGGYELEELLEADERRARFKVRVLGDRTIDAFASFFPAGGVIAQDQIEAWELLRRVPHANLSKPLASGRRELAGAELVYVVLRKADETLEGVLGERALTADEASEVLLSGARALEHLSRHSLVHGGVSPAEVWAVGESIQLSAEGVRKAEGATGSIPLKLKYVAPEGNNGNATTAAAVWCLGATVFETLSQSTCGEECREQAKTLPLGWVLERCLDSEPSKRCKPEEIPALVKSGPPPAVLTPAAPPVSAVEVPPQEIKAAGAAAATAGATSVAAAEVNGIARPVGPEVAPAKPTLSSVSQARTKALKASEFDALTAPHSTVGASGIPRANASAALGGALASPALGASQASAGAARAAVNPGNKFDGARSSGAALFRGTEAEVGGRRAGRPAFGSGAEPQPSRLWMYVAAGVVVVLLLFWALRSKPAKTTNVTPAAATSATQTIAPAASGRAASASAASPAAAGSKAWPTRTLEPDKSASGAAAPAARGEVAKPPLASAASGAVWRVVVYTFNRQEEAEKKVRSINAKHPHLEAQIFSPSGHSSPYLVTVGGRMTREDAARFRSRAIASGLPHDSYIQNYKP